MIRVGVYTISTSSHRIGTTLICLQPQQKDTQSIRSHEDLIRRELGDPPGIFTTSPNHQHQQRQSCSRNIRKSHSTNINMGDLPSPLQINAASLKQTWLKACEHGQLPAAQANGLTTGMNRLALNSDDKLARDWFMEETKALGCDVKVNI